MPTKTIRFKEGRYEGEVNAAGDPEGKKQVNLNITITLSPWWWHGSHAMNNIYCSALAVSTTFTLSSKGAGTLEYPGNDEFLRQFYEGDFVNKKAHGKGMMRWNQGDKYEGDWQEGLRHGEGTYFSKVSNQ